MPTSKKRRMDQSLSDIRDEVFAGLDDFWNNNRKIFDGILRAIRGSMFTGAPIFFGAFLSQIIRNFISQNYIISLQFLIDQRQLIVLIVISTAIWVLGTRWRLDVKDNTFHTKIINLALKRLYKDLGFLGDKDRDVRCTIWTPIDSKTHIEKMKLLQVVDYYPRIQKDHGSNTEFRKNHLKGRVRKAMRKVPGTKEKHWTFGLIGLCACESVENGKMFKYSLDLKETDDIVTILTGDWHYNKAEARRATQDRKSYLVISLMNAEESDLLGISLMDASKPGVFTGDITQKIEEALPHIADALLPS